MRRVVDQGDVLKSLAAEFRRVASLARSECAFYALFPILDLLLWAESVSGESTNSQRADWWSAWESKFPLEMAVWGSAGLNHYENEIAQSPLAYVNQ